jgi:glyoxylase-like metal-dependent hydrolase (beta-lactamase superfamily II)
MIYITHGHGDHWLGLSVLLDRFPHARAVATRGTVTQMRSGEPERSLRKLFPGQIAETVALAEPLDGDRFELEGLALQVIETGHTDTVDTTSLYVPDLGLIVSGDVAYNHCHMYVGATTAAIRAEWIAALDRLAALNPAAVVTGHKDPTRGNPPSVLAESSGYLECYGQLREAALPDRELFDAMVNRYPDWVSRQEFLLLGR